MWFGSIAKFSSRLGALLITCTASISLNCTPRSFKAGSVENTHLEVGSVKPAHVEFEFPPQLVSMKDPEYPLAARKAGAEGTVLVQVLVGEDGLVHAERIVQSVPGLDEASIAAAKGSVWKPGTLKGSPVSVWMVIPVEFKLR